MATAIEANSQSVIMSPSDVKEVSSRQVTPSLLLPPDLPQSQELRKYSFIELSLPYDAEVTLCLYDQTGQEIATIFADKVLQVGSHQLCFSPEACCGIPNFYRLIVKGGSKVYIEVKRLH